MEKMREERHIERWRKYEMVELEKEMEKMKEKIKRYGKTERERGSENKKERQKWKVKKR
jgi:hypothetical protein